MIDRALALNLDAIAKREAANGNDHIAEVLRLTAQEAREGATEIERLRAALKPFAKFANHAGGPSAVIHDEWDVTVADAIRARDELGYEQKAGE